MSDQEKPTGDEPKGRKKRKQVDKKELGPMQQRLVRALPTATTVAQAGEIAGYGTRQSTYRAMKSIRRNAVDILDEIGYGQVKAIQDLREMADRKVVKHFANKGVVMDSKTDEDHQAGHTPRPEEHPPQCGGERTQFPTLPHLSAVPLPVAQIGAHATAPR